LIFSSRWYNATTIYKKEREHKLLLVKPEIGNVILIPTALAIPLEDILAFLGKTVEGMVPLNGIRKETELRS